MALICCCVVVALAHALLRSAVYEVGVPDNKFDMGGDQNKNFNI